MTRSIMAIVFVLALSMTTSSLAELVGEPWCVRCPSGTDLTYGGSDRYYCMRPNTNLTAAAPQWAKPSWAKVIRDVQGGRCIDTYTRANDFCYRCPTGYEFTIALTNYGRATKDINIAGTWNSSIRNIYVITQTENKFSWTVVGHREVAAGMINGRQVNAKWGNGPGQWVDSANGTIEMVDEQGRGTKIVWSNGVVFTRDTSQDNNR